MKISRLQMLPAAWLLVGALGSCSSKQAPPKQQPVAMDPAQQAAAQSQQAFQQEAQALAAQQAKLDAAHKDVLAAQQQLAQARAKEEQERSKVLQLQQQAAQHLQQSRQGALQAQAAAEQAQGLQTVAGEVKEVTPSHVVLQMQGGRMISFNIDPRTKVLVGAQQRSVADIQQGADALVAYDPKAQQPTAVTIRVMPAGN